MLSGLGIAYAAQGEKTEARKILERLTTQSGQYVYPESIAARFAGLGDKDHAFEYLQKAYEEGSIYVCFLKVDPELDPLRSDLDICPFGFN